MIFVDTGAWFALINRKDQWHSAAKAWFEENQEELMTSDYVVAETLNLVKNKLGQTYAVQTGNILRDSSAVALHYLSRDDLEQTWAIFTAYADKEWSFTDCSSFALMQKLGISTAFAFDKHFSQFPKIFKVP